MAGKLSIVATPIGNLGDITYRAIQTLTECDVVLAEDTRTTVKLLAHYQIPHKELVSFFEGNEERKINFAITLLDEGKHVVLVSESGTPLISDPGYKLVREAVNRGITVESVPGPTALISALTVSGLPTNAFLFLGFLPKKEAHVKRLFLITRDTLRDIEQLKTVIFYESPFRLLKTLNLVEQVFGEANIVVARELTKIHEEVRKGKVSEIIAHFEKVKPRGELVGLISV
ncbi:MAG: 16S rRNA (cytidine(1402)-2'-O)-methyltransferase [Candidatus Blackburnbacteria bacterium RIFCSPHIGHO2_01_FULL_43_15b]|uniref:Ribosomal RNA small subunit methyltransferase I n=1 Tax=Candidatus Blackburnbacteria bacterium RIFCSPHIGHO2_01_FULL_43_15b TaxID=1797513 RepID=A0A1G1V174_9BACT|nr:MAG: 16S rRNA (cytidine(1402)-2'-O)-methyltransferase [Candidatus Blackburnbacteria bacterium RIFCSPHIGHO2_01_FULL_43_15b]